MPRDAAPRPAPGAASGPTAPPTARSARLGSRLAVALASAVAIAFVLTIAVVAGSPAPPPTDDASAPPVAGSLDDPAAPPAPTPTSPPSPEPTPTQAPVDPSPPPEPAAPEPTAQPTAPPEPETTSGTEPASPVERSPAPNDHGAALWDRWFRADHLRQGDDMAIVAGDAPLYVGFLRQESGDRLVWMTSCNTFGGELRVRPDRLRLDDIGGTAVACEDENQQDQEAWLADFFDADPNWRSLGERLRLWTPDGRRIDLVEDREGPGPPWS